MAASQPHWNASCTCEFLITRISGTIFADSSRNLLLIPFSEIHWISAEFRAQTSLSYTCSGCPRLMHCVIFLSGLMESGQCLKAGGWGEDWWWFQQFIAMGSPIIYVVYPKGSSGTSSHRVAALMQKLEHYSVCWYVLHFYFSPHGVNYPIMLIGTPLEAFNFGSTWQEKSPSFSGCHIFYASRVQAHFNLLRMQSWQTIK